MLAKCAQKIKMQNETVSLATFSPDFVLWSQLMICRIQIRDTEL